MNKNIIKTFIACLSFVPPSLYPLDFFLKGDPEVISVTTPQNTTYYRVPNDRFGGRFIKPITEEKKLHVYMTTSEEKFNEKMYPNIKNPVDDDAFSITDEVFYSILKHELSKKSYFSGCRLKDIVHILEAIDVATQIKAGRKPMIGQKTWRKIRSDIEREKAEQGINKLNLVSSLIPRTVAENY